MLAPFRFAYIIDYDYSGFRFRKQYHKSSEIYSASQPGQQMEQPVIF